MSEQCHEMYEPVPAAYLFSEARWRNGTHTCSLEAGHLLPHRCPMCGGMWNEPGGNVTPIESVEQT